MKTIGHGLIALGVTMVLTAVMGLTKDTSVLYYVILFTYIELKDRADVIIAKLNKENSDEKS